MAQFRGSLISILLHLFVLTVAAAPGFAQTDTSPIGPGEAIGSGDGQIHVIPTLSAPSVKNGAMLTIRAVVKGQRAIVRVEARIERVGESTGDSPESPVATLALRPMPRTLSGVNPTGNVGLWQADWVAKGLVEAYYRVILTATDSSGHTLIDRSLSFSDPIAGRNTVGSVAYPNGGMRRLDGAIALAGESSFLSAVIDTGAGY